MHVKARLSCGERLDMLDYPPMATTSPIRRLREERGMSMETLAHEAGVSTGTVYRVEKGRVQPTTATARAIADALDVSLDDLFAHTTDGNAPVGVCGESTDTEARRPTLASVQGETGSKHQGA